MSLQAGIAKKLLRHQMSGWSQGTIEEQRARSEGSPRWNRLPAGIHSWPVSAGGVAAEWLAAADADPGVILYLHGGAYALGSINTHREFVARLAHGAGIRGLAIDYRLAPEHPFPAALEDATTAYDWLLAGGVASSRIILAGDSAGGGLALATMVALRDAGKPLPAGAICISPWTDLTLTGASIQGRAHLDFVLDAGSLEMYARLYAGDHDRASPLLSPLFANLGGLPPLLIQVGMDEILLDDARRCAARARQAGVDVTLEVWDGMFHVFQLVPFLPETKRAVGQIARFVSQAFSRSETIRGLSSSHTGD